MRAFKNSLEESQEEIKKTYYRPIETKSSFDNNYIEYESKGEKNKNLSLEDYLNIIRPLLRDTINDHNTHGEWKIQLMHINFISSLDTGEFRTCRNYDGY